MKSPRRGERSSVYLPCGGCAASGCPTFASQGNRFSTKKKNGIMRGMIKDPFCQEAKLKVFLSGRRWRRRTSLNDMPSWSRRLSPAASQLVCSGDIVCSLRRLQAVFVAKEFVAKELMRVVQRCVPSVWILEIAEILYYSVFRLTCESGPPK